jgi:hypothetical protein
MTDPHSDDTHRLDLSALDTAPDRAREDALVAATLARLHPRGAATLPLLTWRRYAALAAAVLAAIALVSLFASRPRGAASDEHQPSQWLQTGHVPSNGELLAAYHGYQP